MIWNGNKKNIVLNLITSNVYIFAGTLLIHLMTRLVRLFYKNTLSMIEF